MIFLINHNTVCIKARYTLGVLKMVIIFKLLKDDMLNYLNLYLL